ncbi:MAG TPA: DJ-1/PfpI family protein [Gemmataceae bacterium]|nr:DJ-1/PfpI family protein [Gemmataceae bacterium]
MTRVSSQTAAFMLFLLGFSFSGSVSNLAMADPAPRPQAANKPEAIADTSKARTLGIVLFPQFELLDVYGPVEMFGNLGSKMKVIMVAQTAGSVASAQGPKVVADYGFDNCPDLDLIMVPGGIGTRTQISNAKILDWLRQRSAKAEIVMSVCTGSALLAKAGLLDGHRATSNKQFFKFAVGLGPKVNWVKEARWVDDGDRVTSSGVTAGIDMALHVIARLYGDKIAQRLADGTEYQWHRDPTQDPFAKFAK